VVRSLLSLYVRAGIGAANLAIRVVVRSADLAADAVRMAIPSTGQPMRSEPEDVFVQPPVESMREPPREDAWDDEPLLPLDEAGDKAKTIDDEPELVAEVAQAGAEDGASAQLQVDEPWDGYDDLTADQVITRIGQADAAELAVIELYERSHKQRRTVLNAAERRHKELANSPS
jgi:hypothetical protein